MLKLRKNLGRKTIGQNKNNKTSKISTDHWLLWGELTMKGNNYVDT